MAWRSSFEYFINVNQTRMAELLARHVDRKLRGEKGVSEAEIESALDKVNTGDYCAVCGCCCGLMTMAMSAGPAIIPSSSRKRSLRSVL